MSSASESSFGRLIEVGREEKEDSAHPGGQQVEGGDSRWFLLFLLSGSRGYLLGVRRWCQGKCLGEMRLSLKQLLWRMGERAVQAALWTSWGCRPQSQKLISGFVESQVPLRAFLLQSGFLLKLRAVSWVSNLSRYYNTWILWICNDLQLFTE